LPFVNTWVFLATDVLIMGRLKEFPDLPRMELIQNTSNNYKYSYAITTVINNINGNDINKQ